MADPLDDKEFMSVKGIAPFEVALIFQEWWTQAQASMRDVNPGAPMDWSAFAAWLCDGRGPPQPLNGETPADFGRRMARGLYLYLKEV